MDGAAMEGVLLRVRKAKNPPIAAKPKTSAG
jgi:hypothetical protein